MTKFNLQQGESFFLPSIDNQLCSQIPKPNWWSSLYEDDGTFTENYKQQLRSQNIADTKIKDLEISNINRLRQYQKTELMYYQTYKKWRTKEEMPPDEDDYQMEREEDHGYH